MKTLAKLAEVPAFETTETVFDSGRDRPVVVELHAGFIKLRLKGTQRSHVMGYGTIITAAVWQEQETKRKGRRQLAALPRARVRRT